MLATVIVSMGVAIGATKVDLDRVPHPDSDTVVSIVLSVLMVTSMVGGAAFVGTQSFLIRKRVVQSALKNTTVKV